jgi:hypothetical protein
LSLDELEELSLDEIDFELNSDGELELAIDLECVDEFYPKFEFSDISAAKVTEDD